MNAIDLLSMILLALHLYCPPLNPILSGENRIDDVLYVMIDISSVPFERMTSSNSHSIAGKGYP